MPWQQYMASSGLRKCPSWSIAGRGLDVIVGIDIRYQHSQALRYGPTHRVSMRLSTLLVASSLLPVMGTAAERTFTYTHDSAVLAPGQHELELWTTWQGGRADQEFRRLDSRLEIEIGVAPETQVAVYLNHRRTSVDGVSESEFEGVSLELKRRLSDPTADGLGSAIYVEGSANGAEVEVELKAIADVRIGAWTAAFNLTGEVEAAEQEADADAGTGPGTTTEYEIKATVACARQLSQAWSLGVELESRNPISENGDLESSTLWAGPAVHLSSPSLWSTLTIMPQLTNLGGEADSGTRELADHSRLEVRLLLGTHF